MALRVLRTFAQHSPPSDQARPAGRDEGLAVGAEAHRSIGARVPLSRVFVLDCRVGDSSSPRRNRGRCPRGEVFGLKQQITALLRVSPQSSSTWATLNASTGVVQDAPARLAFCSANRAPVRFLLRLRLAAWPFLPPWLRSFLLSGLLVRLAEFSILPVDVESAQGEHEGQGHPAASEPMSNRSGTASVVCCVPAPVAASPRVRPARRRPPWPGRRGRAGRNGAARRPRSAAHPRAAGGPTRRASSRSANEAGPSHWPSRLSRGISQVVSVPSGWRL